MAITADTVTLFSGKRRLAYRFTAVQDANAADESAVIKVDRSTLTGMDGTEPGRLVIEKVRWTMQGFNSIRILFDHTTDDEALVLNGTHGELDYTDVGGLIDPNSAGGTGDILFTTQGGAANATYTVDLYIRLKD